MKHASGFEEHVRNDLRYEIEALKKNYTIIKDILSGVKYDVSDVKGTLQLSRTI